MRTDEIKKEPAQLEKTAQAKSKGNGVPETDDITKRNLLQVGIARCRNMENRFPIYSEVRKILEEIFND